MKAHSRFGSPGRVGKLVGLTLLLAGGACRPGDSATGGRGSPAPPARATDGAPIQTDTSAYVLAPENGGWGTRIPFRFTNDANQPMYAVNCNGAVTLILEKREASGWTPFWVPLVNACLSPPVVIGAGETYIDTVEVWGAERGGSIGPEFTTTEFDGTYRLQWTNLVFDYADARPGFGEPVPLPQRISNEFQLRGAP